MDSKIHLAQPIVSVGWLYDNRSAENLVILDGTMNKVFDASQNQIVNARYFDIKNKFSNTSDPFPNAFPSTEQFEREARALGIKNDSAIVVYDDQGIYSSARVWWLFKTFGYHSVAVLSGGFPAWQESGYPIEPMKPYQGKTGNFKANLQLGTMKFFNDVKYISKDQSHKIIDARSAARFNSEEPEPRAGLRSGTIPNSVNLPFKKLLDNGLLKPKEDLQGLFSELADTNEPLVFSCGSGITACILALGAEISGYKHISVYDGSWTEWGTLVEA
ncbi:sulfurtransferase [Aestuariivivens insulae]|uniref:sulfurtransferase n=1 Tax=Aestuariivivens insulae TaxID=1621988 RepID=UPI001F5A64B9|nr:sulfurtransferase [Aestuariivivens insulae]